MLFNLGPSPKQKLQLATSGKPTDLDIPDSWADFAPMLQIRSGSGLKPFDPYEPQKLLSELADIHSFLMIPKSRQMGISQWALSKILHEMLRRDFINCVVISRRNLDAFKLGRRMIQMIDSASIPTIRKSAAEIVLYNGSRCIFAEPGDNAARSEDSVSIVLLDEFGAMAEPELTMGSVLPTMSLVESPQLWIVFTPNGKQHYSYKLLSSSNPANFDLLGTIRAIRDGTLDPIYHWIDNDGWCKILLHWRAHPLYGSNPDYLEQTAKTQKLVWKRVLREYDLSFDESEMQYISDALIDACANGEYEDPIDGSRYFAGLDASSVGADYFCFAVLKEEGNRLSLVELYRARRRSMQRHLARIAEICSEYSIEAAQVETNSFGQIYYEELSQKHRDINWQRFTASNRTNIEILERMLMRMESGTLSYPANPTILRELRGLEQDPISGKIEAGNTGGTGESEDDELHDDIPRSIALAINAWEDRPKRNAIDLGALKSAINPD